MVYPVFARPARPGTVTAAAVLLFLAAAALLAVAAAQVSVIGPTGRAIDAASVGTESGGLGTTFTGFLFGGGAALNALFGLGLVVLAGLDLGGKRPARVVTWIFAPLSVLCCGCLSGVYTQPLFTSAGTATPGPSAQITPEQLAAIADALPSWYTPGVLFAVALVALCVLLVVILLAVPSSNRYFRKRPEGWVPAPGWPGDQGTNASGQSPQGYPPQGYPPQGYPPQG